MSNQDIFMKRGAEIVAGAVVYARENVGFLRDGEMILTDAGRDKLAEIAAGTNEPVETREPARRAAAKKAPKAVEAAHMPEHSATEAPPAPSLDDLLG